MNRQGTDAFPESVEIIEVGLRDGLQNEPTLVATAEKAALIDALAAAGLKRIQVSSFVHPRLVPQMADAEALCALLTPYPDVVYSGLALNLKGVDRAHAAGITHIDISVSASEDHSRRNANRSVAEALREYDEMVVRARSYGMAVRGGIQCAFGYRRSDDVDPAEVVRIAHHFLLDLGVDELALADSSGLANPRQMQQLLTAVLPLAHGRPLILHLHDTRGMGQANVLAALAAGVRHFDTAFGGLGGCPFIAGATGNIATEDTVYMLHAMGIATGIDLARVAAVSQRVAALLDRDRLDGKLYRLLVAEA